MKVHKRRDGHIGATNGEWGSTGAKTFVMKYKN